MLFVITNKYEKNYYIILFDSNLSSKMYFIVSIFLIFMVKYIWWLSNLQAWFLSRIHHQILTRRLPYIGNTLITNTHILLPTVLQGQRKGQNHSGFGSVFRNSIGGAAVL